MNIYLRNYHILIYDNLIRIIFIVTVVQKFHLLKNQNEMNYHQKLLQSIYSQLKSNQYLFML